MFHCASGSVSTFFFFLQEKNRLALSVSRLLFNSMLCANCKENESRFLRLCGEMENRSERPSSCCWLPHNQHRGPVCAAYIVYIMSSPSTRRFVLASGVGRSNRIRKCAWCVGGGNHTSAVSFARPSRAAHALI